MVKKKTSGSENRRLKHAVLVRMDERTYGGVHYRADALKVSDASVIRDVLVDEFGAVDPDAQMVKMKRGTNQKITPEIREALTFVAELRRVGNNFNQSVHAIHSARHRGEIDESLFRELSGRLNKLNILLSSIKNEVTGALDLQDDD
ncbi:hypothetical protein [Ruegeria arenilitoris]|uniref:hypothetical protein n=1 Tax=Ruegeria arenilitoris TaxID=1173585 RepID=UPI0014798EB0|nr:hypothetical protein [Ruegeria arenilitoris]